MFLVEGKRSFDVSLSDVSKAQVTAGKDEIVLEFTQPDHVNKKQDSLIEMRFYVPNTEQEEGGESEEIFTKSVDVRLPPFPSSTLQLCQKSSSHLHAHASSSLITASARS